jgi:hypothetical protein
LKQSASLGHSDAKACYGIALAKGDNCSQDFSESVRYLKESADEGNSLGQYRYGRAFSQGEGVPKDDSIAANYYKLSADQGNSSGQNAYGVLLLNGDGVSKNSEEAAKYFKLSADQGNPLGQFNYARRLKNGDGVSKGLNEAAKYYKLSADQGNASAQNSYGWALEMRIGVSTLLKKRNITNFQQIKGMRVDSIISVGRWKMVQGWRGTLWKRRSISSPHPIKGTPMQSGSITSLCRLPLLCRLTIKQILQSNFCFLSVLAFCNTSYHRRPNLLFVENTSTRSRDGSSPIL